MPGHATSTKRAERESVLLRRVMLEIGHGPVRAFRNNVGVGWAGRATMCRNMPMTVTLQPGDVVVRGAHPLHAGLCEGSSDIIGWRSVRVLPYMLGRTLAVFMGLEIKSPDGRIRQSQERFQEEVKSAGGIAGTVRSVDDALAALII